MTSAAKNTRLSNITSFTSSSRFRDILRVYGLVIVMVLIAAIIGALEPSFLSVNNLNNILYQVAIIGMMALFSTPGMIAGCLDISVGATVALSGLTVKFALEAAQAIGAPWPIALLAPLAVGVTVGLVNGVLVARFNLPPVVVTLGTMSMVRGTALILGGGTLHLIRGPEQFLFIGGGRPLGIPLPIIIFAVVFFVLLFVETRTTFGLTVKAIGQNMNAARLSGLSITRTKMLVYVISGVGAAIAGIVLASQVNTAAATYGQGYELDVIAAIVIGGTSLMGGIGSVRRSALGALFIGEVNNGLTVLNVNSKLLLVAKGLVIIVGMALDNMLNRWARE